jgi:flagellin FlaB
MLQVKENKTQEASIGIGAMIVFIALILVAAVASAVIIQTAEKLQQNAQSIGDDTRDEIAGKIQIHAAYYGDDGEGFDLVFSLAPGSGTIRDVDVKFQMFCLDDAGALAQDAGDFDDEIITSLSGTALAGGVGTADTLAVGTKYVIPIGDNNVLNCNLKDVNTGWAAPAVANDGAVSFYLHVIGGGSTFETLDASGTLDEGVSVL